MANWYDVQPDRNLLDNAFEGYKLSLEKLTCYDSILPPSSGVLVSDLPMNEYSLQHVKLFSTHNHLAMDPWCRDTVYYINNEMKVIAMGRASGAGMADPVCVFSDLSGTELSKSQNGYNVTLSFPSETLALLSDGMGKLILLETGCRAEKKMWQPCLTSQPAIDSTEKSRMPGFVIMDSLLSSVNNEPILSYITAHVAEQVGAKAKFETIVIWRSFSLKDGLNSWTPISEKKFCTADVEFASLDMNGCLHLASKLHDFGDDKDESYDAEMKESNGPKYTWIQSDEDITAQFSVPDGITKHNIQVNITPKTLQVCVNGETLLEGTLHRPVNINESTWTVSKSRLEVFVTKQDEGWWNEFISGDDRGEMVTDTEAAEKIHKNLEYLTSEGEPMEGTAERQGAVNSDELEACDYRMDDATFLCRFDQLGGQKPTHVVNFTGNQWLFNTRLDHKSPISFCTRHDVDGLVWQPTEDARKPYKHQATFNALGYVQASKEKRKFISCSPSYSFAVIADMDRQIYIYRQPSPVDGELRNRSTGRKVQAVSKQQLISLSTNDSILGMSVSDELIFILTQNTFHMIRV